MGKTISNTIQWREYESENELPDEEMELIKAAVETSANAYAPYSGFMVGAAVRLENGLIIRGTNIENSAFPSGICAERNALSTSASCYPDVRPVAIAIAARVSGEITDEPASPCGNCRQVIAEEEYRNHHPVKIILKGKSKVIVIDKGGDLLPLQFNPETLRPNSP